MTDRRDKLQGMEEFVKPEEEEPILVAAEYLKQRNATKGFEAVRQLAQQRGWTVEVFPTGKRERNVARYLAKDQKLQIWSEGHSWDRLLWELAHELAWGSVSLRAKSQLTEEAGIRVAQEALVPLTDRELELRDHTEDEELQEALGDKSIYRMRLESDRVKTEAAKILYEHQ